MENTNKKIRLGICMAGAVSAGAYTAGVMDYLIETLERWQQRKETIRRKIANKDILSAEDALVPMHDVVIEVLSGASAGGMTAAILGYSLNDESYLNKRDNEIIAGHYDVPQESDTPSKLYDVWINMADDASGSTFAKLMNTNDVVSVEKMKSILNSQPIDDLANKAVPGKICFSPPEYISDHLSIILSVTNLEGIPIDIRFSNVVEGDPTCNVLKMHSGFLHYQFKNQYVDIDFPPEIIDDNSRDHLAAAAKATGAFPFGLANRKIEVNHVFFNEFKGRMKQNYKLNVNLKLPQDNNYIFNAIDGGAINNEPIGTTVKILESKKKLYHPGNENYLILIDPFPTVTNAIKREVYEEPKDYTLLQQFFKIIGVFRNQSMFKQEDLLNGLEMDQNRFLIYPSKKGFYFLASGLLEGFAGFFKKDFRRHDYQLGRKNCQTFLRYYLGEEVDKFNTITDTELTSAQIKQWGYNVNYERAEQEIIKIPLIPDMLLLHDPSEIAAPAYNGITTKEFAEATDLIRARSKAILDKSYGFLTGKGKAISSVLGLIMKFFPRYFKRRILNFANAKLKSYLENIFYPQSIKQEALQLKYADLIHKYGKLFQKHKGVYASIAKGGEHIVSVTHDGTETRNIANAGDFIVKNDTSSNELYIIQPEAFHKRYVHDAGDHYVPNRQARVYALQITDTSIIDYNLGELGSLLQDGRNYINIEASWNESQTLRLNDYLVTPVSKNEVYRIARSAFNETYREVLE